MGAIRAVEQVALAVDGSKQVGKLLWRQYLLNLTKAYIEKF